MNPVASTDSQNQEEALVIRSLGQDDHEAWDRFVLASDEGSFFHLSGWRRVIEDICGHRSHYLYATRGSRITGVLPLAEIKSRIFGHSLISTPFCVYGGVASISEVDRLALEQEARRLAESLQVDYLELRNMRRSPGDWAGKELYVTFRKRISKSDDDNLKAIPRKQRAVVRKGIDAGLKSETNVDVRQFYSVYSESLRNLGTPVLPRKFFEALVTAFGNMVDILTVHRDGRPVSSVMNFYFRDEVLPYYGGGLSVAREIKANDFMYWDLMRHAVARGATLFDFGRSKIGTGSYSFKKNWGFEPQNLEYQYHLVGSRAVPNLSPMNPKYRAMIATWKILPVRVTQLVGPVFAKSLG